MYLVHKYGRRKSTKTSGVHFFYKSSFFTLESQHTCAQPHRLVLKRVKPVKIKRRDFFFVSRTVENSEVQIAVHVVSKWNMLRHWKLVLGFSVFVYLQPSMNTRYFDRLKGLWHASVHMWHLDFWSGEPFFKISIWWKNPLLSTLRRPRKLLYQYSRTIWSMFGSFKRHILYFNLVQALSRKFEAIED